MTGKGGRGRDRGGQANLLCITLAVLSLPWPMVDASVSCPASVDEDCICDTRKGENQRGGWEIFCTEANYRLEYAIRSFVKLECSPDEQGPTFAPAMFTKYNFTDVDYFQIVMCPLPPNVTLAEVLEGVKVRKLKFEADVPGTDFSSSTFEGLTSLENLILRKNQLESVPEDLFANLTFLKSVEINENNLKSLPERLFEGLENLTSIQLGGNELQDLPTGIFTNLTKLERLYLYKNKLSELPAGIFLGLKALGVLDMANNRIQELHHELFLDTPKLKHLNVRGNNLTRLQSDLLHGTKFLEELDLSDNKLIKLPENLLEGLTNLKTISLNNCKLKGIGEGFFAYAPRLTSVSMNQNKLTSISQDLFANNRDLQKLFIQHNDISELPSNVFDKNINVETLKITHNNLTSLPMGIFDHLTNLKYLDISANALKTLNSDLLVQNQKLLQLYASNNQLTDLQGDHPFGQSSALEIVDFSFNRITSLPEWINWGVYLGLQKLNLNNNSITTLTIPDIFSYAVGASIELTSNQISKVNLEHVRWLELAQQKPPTDTIKIELASNPLDCSCRLFDFLNYTRHKNFKRSVDFTDLDELECKEPDELSGTKLTEIRPEAFVCQVTEDCPINCYCIERAIDKATIINCSYLTDLPDKLPRRTTEVHLEDNRIVSLNELGSSVWKNVTRLYLDRNNITIGDWDLPPNLQVLSLRGNRLEYMSRSLTDFVENNDNVQLFLGDNPWLCDCQTLQLKDWLYENIDKIMDVNDMYCGHLVFQNGSEVRTTVGRLTEDICPEENVLDNGQIILVSVVCTILACILFLVSVLYYRNKQTVIAYIYIHFHNVFVCFFSDNDLDEDKAFDAFVSYSSADRDVAMELVGHLENGDPSFKICIHERDWLPGNLISWNIVNSVQNSRKTILVLSKQFLESVWFQVEFHTAYYQMLEDRIDRLIVVVRGDLPEKNTLDKELQFLLSTKTFLEWGERWFWEKLRYALPHRRGTSNAINQKSVPQTKGFPLSQRPNNPGLLKTVEEKIVSLSGDTIFSKRTDSQPSNGQVQVNVPIENKTQTDSVQVGNTKAQSRRFNGARTNSQSNGLNNKSSSEPPQEIVAA